MRDTESGQSRPVAPRGPAAEWQRGVDQSQLVRWWAGGLERLVPRRFRGAPLLFYPVICVNVLWGICFLFYRVSGLPVPAWDRLRPAPPLPTAAWDAVATIAAALGVAQALGTFMRARWGLAAAYALFACSAVLPWLPVVSAGVPSGADVILAFGLTIGEALLGGYYYRRRAWFQHSKE